MGNEVKCERVVMFRVIPAWGTKNLRVSKVNCVRRGKTLYVPNSRIRKYGKPNLHPTANAAIDQRIKELKGEMDPEPDKWIEDIKGTIKTLTKLRT